MKTLSDHRKMKK